jgi:hypothetical protein
MYAAARTIPLALFTLGAIYRQEAYAADPGCARRCRAIAGCRKQGRLDVIYQLLCLKMRSPLALRRSFSFGRRQQVTVFHTRREEQTKMTNEEILGVTVLNSWKLAINRFGKNLSELNDEQLQQRVAPGKNRVFYLLGHLTAMHDRMFPLLGLGDRLHGLRNTPALSGFLPTRAP